MTPKQRRFVDEYLQDFNATQAAIRAGYSARSAHVAGSRLLNNDNIAAEIEHRVEELAMGANERLITLAEIGRDLGERTSNRIRAIELLGKLAGDYVEKVDHSGSVSITLDWGDDA